MSVLNKIVSYFPNINITTNGADVNLLSLLKSEKHKKKILHIRVQTDKTIQKQLKNELPYYTVTGIFNRRCNEGLINYSGLADVDLDSAEDYDIMDLLEQLKLNPYIAYAGLSCSGNRLHCIIPFLHPADKYEKQYERLIKSFVDWGLPMGDDCQKKISQPRFVSWNDDTTHWFNHNAKPYPFLAPEKTIYTIPHRKRSAPSTIASSPFDIAAKILDKQGNYFQDGNRHNYIFGLCCWLNKIGIPQAEAEQYINDSLLPLSEIRSNCITFPYRNYSAEVGTFDFDRDRNNKYSVPIPTIIKQLEHQQSEPEPPQQVKIEAVQELQPVDKTKLVDVKVFEPIEPAHYFSKPEQPTKPERWDGITVWRAKRQALKNWEQDITELENYFTGITLPTQPVKLNQWSTIPNVARFIESYFTIVKAQNGNRNYRPYLERLQELMGVLQLL